jgi:hypothetical protein
MLFASMAAAQDSAPLAEIVEDELEEITVGDSEAPPIAEGEEAPESGSEPDSELEEDAESEPDSEPESETVDEHVAERPGLWAPPRPDATAFDWLQMSSGEWLKGDFLGLRDWRVRFDSDEFDELDLDWKKVTSLHLPRAHSFRVQGRVVFGTAELRGDVLKIRTEDEILEFRKEDLSAVAQGSGGETDYWSFRLGVSLGARQGNSDQVDLSGTSTLLRETALTRFRTDYRGIFSKVDGEKSVNNHRVNSAFDYFITQRTYLTIPFVEYFNDEFQNLDARVTPGVSIGYELIRDSVADWEASIGGAYQYTLLTSEVDEARSSHDFAVVARTELNLDIAKGIELDSIYRLQLIATDFGKTNHHGESELSFDVWGPVELDVQFIWDRIEEPASQVNDDGETDTPKSDDFRLLVGLSLDF